MEQILSTAQNFIALYYSFAVNAKKDTNKFYDPSAMICRDGSSTAVKISEFKGNFFPEVKIGSEFNIVDYSVVPLEEGKAFNLTVTGNYSYCGEQAKTFTQCFTLKFFEEKAAIVSDSLYVAPTEHIIVPEKDLVECKPYEGRNNNKKQNKKRNNNNDKFKPYIASKV